MAVGIPVVTVDQIRRTSVRIRSSAFDDGGSGATHVATQYRVRFIADPLYVYFEDGRPMLTTEPITPEGNFVYEDGVLKIVEGAPETLVTLLVGDSIRVIGAG